MNTRTISLILAGAVGCSTDFAVPQEAQLGCKSAGDCPSGWTCNEKVGRCVKTESIDADAPALVGEVTVAPAMLKKGAKATVSFEVSEELSKEPVVTLSAGSERALTLVPQPSPLNYVFSYTAAGDEPQSVESAISIVLTDKSGNESGKLSGKSVKFDFIAPGVVDAVVAGSPVNKDGTATVTFTVNETPASVPVVKLATGEALSMAEEPKDNKYTFTYKPTTDESQDVAGIGVTVDLVDGAGNEANGVDLGAIVFDFVKPALKGAPVVSPSVARAGATVTVTFETTEPMGDNLPIVKVGDAVLSGSALPGNAFEFGYKVEGTDADGEKAITISLVDPAGNESAGLDGGTFAVDSTAPTATATALNAGPYRSPSGAETDIELSFSFTTSEELDPDAGQVILHVLDAGTAVCPKGKAKEFTCTFTMPRDLKAKDPLEGLRIVMVELHDAAGNINGVDFGAVFFDFTPPVLTLTTNPTGRPARLGELVTVGVASSEALDGSGVVLDAGALSLGAPSGSGTSFSWTYTVKATDSGSHNLSATAKDAAGNAAVAPAAGTLALDGVVPTVSNPQLNPGRVAKGGMFVLTFSVSEAPGADPTVTFSNGIDASIAMSKASKIGLSYTYTGTAPGAGAASFYAVTVSVQDAAGNGAVASAGTVEIDNTPPQLAGLEVAPAGAKMGDTIRVVLTADEVLSGAPALTAKSGADTIAFTALDGAVRKISYTYTYAVTGASPQGSYALQPFTLTDEAGNPRDVTPAKTFAVDSTAPAVTAHAVGPGRVKAGQLVTVTLTAGEALSGDPLVRLGTLAMSKTGQAGQQYTFTYTTLGTEGDGTRTASVQMTDVAGNVGGAAFDETVELDFTSPSVATSSAGPSPAKRDALLIYRVTVSEPITNTPALTTTPALAWTGPTRSGSTYTWTHTVSGGEGGAYTAKIDQLCDLAANCATDVTAGLSGFIVDAAPPVITAVSVSSSNADATLAKGGDTVTAIFTCDEDLPQNPQVTLGGLAMGTPTRTGTGPYSYTYTRTVSAPSGDTDGVKTATVTSTDAAGNTTVKDIGGVTVDFTPPSITAGSDTIQLIPFTGSLLPTVTKVAMNSTARVSFSASEALSGDPVVTINPSAGTWSIAKFSSAGNSYVYDIKPTGGSPTQGVTQVRVSFTDLAGNGSGTLALPVTFTVDTAAPTSITAAQNDKILYRRIPWGADATAGVKKFSVKTLDAQTNAVEANSTVIFWDAADTATAAEIGRMMADGNGYFAEKDLNRADRAHVYLTQVDAAGNVDSATATEVKNHEWTATMGYKVPGSTIENPHVFTSTGIISGWLTQDLETNFEPVPTDLQKIARTDADAMLRAAEASWVMRNRDTKPAARINHAMVYDRTRGRVVMFGGVSTTPMVVQDTWEWDGATDAWMDRTPAGKKPSARYGHKMVYDSARGRVVMFGGHDEFSYLQDTWEWDGDAGTWTDRTPAGTKPAVREAHDMAYDSARRRVVLFGGANSGPDRQDTWEWDGLTGAWTDVTPSGAKPGVRFGHAMAYDSVRGFVLMFGGYHNGSLQDTWKWDGAAKTWTEVTPAGTKPSARSYHSIVYDSSRGIVALFGGSDGTGVRQDSWEWDGAVGSWTEVTPTGTKPSARTGHAMAYDHARGRAVMFGGQGTTIYLQDTWKWDRASISWVDVTSSSATPSARSYHSMVYDSSRGRVVLFGGNGLQDTWEWDGAGGTWRDRTPSGSKPSARQNHAMAYDSARGRVVMFGGCCTYFQDTWEWDGAAGTWTNVTPAGVKPTARQGHAMAYDSARSRVVMFGGTGSSGYLQDTWEWDGATGTWSDRTPAGTKPSVRTEHAMAYDSARGRAVLFGGDAFSMLQDTWEWDGTAGSWQDMAPAGTKPSMRFAHSLVFDSARGRTMLFGGRTEDGLNYQDTWEWDGANRAWTERTPAGTNPEARYGHAMAYDSALNKVTLFGGSSSANGGETWEWVGGTYSRPGQIMQATFTAAGITQTPTWQSVRGTFNTGGTGYPDYVRNDSMLTWSDAKTACENMGSGVHLATVADENERRRISAFATGNYPGAWLGGSDIATEGTWLWVDGTPWSYTFWDTGEPNNYNGDQGCLQMYPGFRNYRWDDDYCYIPHPSICEYPSTTTNGVNLMAWDEERWKTVATSSASAASPAQITWSTTDAAVIQRMAFGSQKAFNFAVTPVAPNGTGTGQVSVDYAEVVVSYRL